MRKQNKGEHKRNSTSNSDNPASDSFQNDQENENQNISDSNPPQLTNQLTLAQQTAILRRLDEVILENAAKTNITPNSTSEQNDEASEEDESRIRDIRSRIDFLRSYNERLKRIEIEKRKKYNEIETNYLPTTSTNAARDSISNFESAFQELDDLKRRVPALEGELQKKLAQNKVLNLQITAAKSLNDELRLENARLMNESVSLGVSVEQNHLKVANTNFMKEYSEYSDLASLLPSSRKNYNDLYNMNHTESREESEMIVMEEVFGEEPQNIIE
ncbi:hypothetical protein TRFO_16818 [Tritrichomonas foetus]|uniref:Uncharacterized protein n=1 Tax=Tritrichomonas foetus TaxID=1144522 RepID=A0A1J4KPC8_9EUKA|nr:hypothetical protein TRFO_16818 [Tritrichomonas foetus]|eukprot:OHT13153.1 hypothetical protein TRFO_16818 [Tritrichomonas foetus]